MMFFRTLKKQLALIFTGIVAFLLILNGILLIEMEEMSQFKMFTSSLQGRILLLVIETAVISILTYLIGKFFASRSIKPAEEMFGRLEQFTQDASHELKTPLSVAGTSLELATKTNDPKYITKAQNAVRTANTIIDQLLLLARIGKESVELEKVDLHDTVNEIADLLSVYSTDKELDISIKIKKDVQLTADKELLERAISNLFDNAIKFNKQCGTILIEGNEQYLRISNTGAGIAEKDISMIFERFFQGDASHNQKGYGIGLSLVKRICEIHGWKVSVSSNALVTTFTLTFS
jgi:signal transduction histidine kinase